MPAGAKFSWRHMAVAAATLAAAEAQCARKRYVVGVLHLVSQAIESSHTERSVPPTSFGTFFMELGKCTGRNLFLGF